MSQAAKMLHVGEQTVHAARRVIEGGTVEEIAAIHAGKLRVVPLAKLIRRGVSVADRAEFGPRQSRPPRPCYRLPLNKAVRIDRDRPAPARCDAKGRALPFHDDLVALNDHGSLGMLPPRG